MSLVKKVDFRFYRGNADDWTEENPLLSAGEPGFELDTNKLKIGDGFHFWNELDYLTGAGAAGDSAYEVAVDNGFVGTEEEWLESLVGPPGADGNDGAPGPPGADGNDGAPGPAGPSSDVYPMSAYGFVAASMSVETARVSTSFGCWVVRIWVPAGKIITKVGVYVSSVGSAGSGLNSFAIYSDSGTLIQSTPTDNNLWIVEGWTLRSLSVPISAEGSGRFVRAAVALNGSSPNVLYASHDGPATLYNGGDITHRRGYAVGSRSSWPSTINPATEGDDYPFLPLVVLA